LYTYGENTVIITDVAWLLETSCSCFCLQITDFQCIINMPYNAAAASPPGE